MKKYELTDETKYVCGATVHRIRAVRDFADVKAGDLGGYIESEKNLSHEGNAWVSGNAEVYGGAMCSGNAWVYGDAVVSDYAWVYGDAVVYGNAVVCGDAVVYGNARVSGDARVSGNARVCGNACVCGDARIVSNSDYMTFKNSWSSCRWFTYTSSNKLWKVGFFYGDGEQLIRNAYADSELSGRCYEAIVRAVEAIEAAKAANTEVSK